MFLGEIMKKFSLTQRVFIAAAPFLLYSCASKPQSSQVSLQQLILEGRYDEAKDLFRTKTNINAVDEYGNTALHLAAQLNESDLISFLIAKGADTTIKNKAGDIPLHVAIKNDNIESARILSIIGGDIFIKDGSENTALELAMARGENWYNVVITQKTGDIRDIEGKTIVHYFVKTRNEKAIDVCISQKLDINIKDNKGGSPLAEAYKTPENSSAIRIASALLLAGAEGERGDFAYFEDAVRTHNPMLRFSDGQTALHIATISGHTGVVDYIIHQNGAIRTSDLLHSQDISGATPLHESVRYGRTNICRMLLDAGSQVDALDSIGKTPLLLIVPKDSQSEIYNILIQHGANINQKDMYGDTVLHIATMAEVSPEVLELLVKEGAPVNERNKQGVTPLSLAIERKLDDEVVFYAKNGADIFAEDREGNTPLTQALDSSTINMLKTLITSENVLSKDSAGNTPLHYAIMRDSPAAYIQYLVETGADVNARNKNGDSVLYLTVQKNNRDAGSLLLDRNADIFATNTQNYSPLRLALTNGGELMDWVITSQTLNTTDGSGNTPLHYAAEWQLNDAIIALIEKGAKINAVNSNGETALFSAVKSDSVSTVNILIEYGAVIDTRNSLARDYLGNTPLHSAVRWSAFNVAKDLINNGIDVDAQNLSGKTALCDACRSGKYDMAQLLLDSSADINATDATGRTVLMDAIQSMSEPMISMLLANGANPHIQEMYGRNAYHDAACTGNINIINLIRKAGGNPLSRDVYGDTPFSLVLGNEEKVIRAVLGNNTTIVDSDGNTPVHIAVTKKVSKAKLTMLLNMGYPVSQRNSKGLSALNEAVALNQKKLAIVLLERGADPYLSTTSGENALTSAFKTNNIDILDAIVKYCSKKTDRQGDGILHYACRMADENTVIHLLSLNLDKDVKNISGETPYQMALRWNRSEIAELLK